MNWRVDFHHDRRRILARYDVEAPGPAAAVALGREALRAAHPAAATRRRATLLEQAEGAGTGDATGWVLYRIARLVLVAAVLLGAPAAVRTAAAQVPTAADIAACNDEAPQAVKEGGVSPNAADRARADRALSRPSTTSAGAVESPDPQIHGMQADAATDPRYQAAYRSCMRRRGF